MPRVVTSKTVASRLEREYQGNKRLIEESMIGLPKSSRAYLDRILALEKITKNYLDQRIARGLDPVNLSGTMQKVYEFRAEILTTEHKLDEEREAFNAALDAEYGSPAPEPIAPKQGRKKSRFEESE